MTEKPVMVLVGDPEKKPELEKAAKILNGIKGFVSRYGWRKGFRNDMSVNFCIACDMLGLDAGNMFNEHIFNIEKVKVSALEDFSQRHKVISKYLEKWRGDPLFYVINIEDWLRRGEHCTDPEVMVKLIPE